MDLLLSRLQNEGLKSCCIFDSFRSFRPIWSGQGLNLIHFLFSEFLEYRFWKNFRTSCKFYSELEAVSHRFFFNRDYCFLCRYVFVFLEKKNFEHFSPYNSYCILRVPLRLELPTVLFERAVFLIHTFYLSVWMGVDCLKYV